MNPLTKIILSTLLIFTCFTPILGKDTELINKLVTADNDFGFRLFGEIVDNYELENIFISPASIAMALDMTYNGAKGETKKVMSKTLRIEKLDLKELNQANLDLRKLLENPDSKVVLNIANSLWADTNVTFKSIFLKRNKNFYDAEVTALNMYAPNAPARINKWVKEKTNNKIEKVIDQIEGNTVMILINAIYFNGKWQIEFDTTKTEERAFTLLNGKQIMHPMMSQSGKYQYLKGDKFQAISLPYSKGQMSMYIFLPGQNSNLKEFLSGLKQKNWENWMSKFNQKEGDIVLPRFKLEYGASLEKSLIAMGMGNAFTDHADFSEMCSGPHKPYIGDVRHKTFIEVNEQGTEAAAITAVVMLEKTGVTERFNMIVDRPFFCAIRDNKTGSILFMGAIVEPK